MRYYIIAGEASGDLHGANLMRALLRKDPDAQFRFWGGDSMREVAGEPVRHIRDLAIMGFVEVMLHLRTVLGNIRLCKQDILQYRPDAIVFIDYPGFNLRIAKFTHKHGFKNIHYISPQLWAWKKGRIKTMRRDLDCLCYILPFEQDFYAHNHFPQAVYVGHPLLDAVSQYRQHASENSPIGTHSRPIIAVLPGSRKQELKRVFPLMLRIADAHPEYDFVVAGMSLLGEKYYQPFIASHSNVSVVYDQTYTLLSCSYAALVCSGTATLETALFNVPQVVCYKANPISVAIARQLVSSRIKYISLVNLILDAPLVTELIQQDLNVDRLNHEFALITVDTDNRQRIAQGYSQLYSILGNAGASDHTADAIISTIKQNPFQHN